MMKYSTFSWYLVHDLESTSVPARHQPHILIPSTQTINWKKAKNPKTRKINRIKRVGLHKRINFDSFKNEQG